MLGRKALLESTANKLWRGYARATYAWWRLTGIRSRFLSSKGQDRWIIKKVYPDLRGGYFLELGAGNGFVGSDTFILEQDYGWSGICIEANPLLFAQMTSVVKRTCKCVCACIDGNPGVVEFALTDDTGGIVSKNTDNSERVRGMLLRRLRRLGRIERLPARTLAEVLVEHNAPPFIHYFSLDVEGAEERILSSFPFDKYQIQAMTVERPSQAVHALLLSVGFALVRYHFFDGFYINNTMHSDFEALRDQRFERKMY
jgi:hypothetical protein